ncbi:MAG: hypothetical protein H6741_22990 [Alphaproteobacteria bacterium]|nr:hypothetical protein [Alphaproteobacteria bacterium]
MPLPRLSALPLLLAACTGPDPAPPAPTPPVDPPVVEDLCETRAPIYNSKGVHNDCLCESPTECTSACAGDKCDAKRGPDDPPDPRYAEHWVSEWTMYRVYQNYKQHPPPWGSPPEGLTPEDYEVSYGASYYDNAYVPADGDGTGAMMEHYDKRCLPIFPIPNDYSCSFISLGNKAYFLTYEEDRPEDMPPCCVFSPYNHPPRPDFVKHLPYSAEDSSHVDDSLQAYRYVTPDGVWFAYAFWKDKYADPDQKHLLPQSFYFSGAPTDPPNAPFVSQNFSNFRIESPDPTQTWDQVAKTCTAQPLPDCQLFDPPEKDAEAAAKAAPLWHTQDFPAASGGEGSAP